MKQKIQDLTLLLKSDRKAQAIAGCCVLALLFLAFSEPPKRRGVPQQQVAEVPVQSAGMGFEEAFQDLVTTLQDGQKKLGEDMQKVKTEMADIRTDQENAEMRTAEIFKKLIDRIQQQQTVTTVSANQPPDPVDYKTEFPQQEPDALEPFGDVDDTQVAPPAPPKEAKEVLISPGDSVRIKLLAGVNAPTDGTPYPVIFKLISDINGPDSSSLPVGEARLIAAAQGSMVDSRAIFRLTSLSMRFPNGERRTVDVDGWIVGEDGLRGMQGILLDPLGKAIGGAMTTGTVAGLGQALSDSQVTTERQDGTTYQYLTGDTTSYALGKGLSEGASEWSKIIQNRLSELTPMVQVFSGREATAVFSQAVVIDGLYDAIDEEESDIFAMLD
ncbi:MAG: TraB/VirB10 family protein [Bdellovibrionales bacterium]|nr:TraB/VirB10 family protein [Bdellovibrionales bacterium]